MTKLFISGHTGMVGGALVRRFQNEPGISLVLRSRKELDLTDQAAVHAFYAAEKPDAVIVAAGKVGASTPTAPIRPSSFIRISPSPPTASTARGKPEFSVSCFLAVPAFTPNWPRNRYGRTTC